MRKEKDHFKFPIYWSDFFMDLSDKQAGKLLNRHEIDIVIVED